MSKQKTNAIAVNASEMKELIAMVKTINENQMTLMNSQEKLEKRIKKLEKGQAKTQAKTQAKSNKKQEKVIDAEYKEIIDARENKDLVKLQKKFKENGLNAKFEKTARENYSLCVYGVKKDDKKNQKTLKDNGFRWYGPKACWFKTK